MAGITALFYSPMLVGMAWGVAASVFAIQVVSQKLETGVRRGPRVVPSADLSSDTRRLGALKGKRGGNVYRIWTGMQQGTKEDGRVVSLAEEVFTIP